MNTASLALTLRGTAAALALSLATTSFGDVQFSAAGSSGDIQATLDAFRSALGSLNANGPGSVGGGRREINWDGVPDANSSPNALPGDFFNAATGGRARGVVLQTPGDHLEVSAKTGNPTNTPVEFGNIDANYVEQFTAFSPQRLFAPVGSTTTVVTFFVPGTITVTAQVTGFGAIFTDVDAAGTTITAFDKDDNVLGTVEAPVAAGAGLFSFAGLVVEGTPRIARVEIVSGTIPLATGNLDGRSVDVVAMDDFVYGEPTNLLCPYDLNGDSIIGAADLAIVLGAWDVEGATPADLDGDGIVGSYDLAYLLGAWGNCE